MRLGPLFSSLICLSVLSCSSGPSSKNVPELKTIPRVHQIKVGGEGTIHLGEISQTSLKTDQLLTRTEKLLQEKKFRSIRYLVQQFPDLVLLSLRNHSKNPSEVLSVLARFYDELFLGNETQKGWSALLRHRENVRQTYSYTLFDQQRALILETLQRGRFEEATQLPLAVPASPSPLLTLESYYLKGISFLLANQNEQATDFFSQGVELTRSYDRYQEAHFLLLLSATQQRQEKQSLANQTWEKAVIVGNQAEAGGFPSKDPIFWNRAIDLKSHEQPWPTLFANTSLSDIELGVQKLFGSVSTSSTALVWEYLGHCHLKRNEGQSALLAFRTSQSLEKNPLILEQLQISQSKALLLLKQEASATNILLNLAQNPNAKTSSPALAILGVIDLKRAETQRGLGLILRALEKGQREEWRGKAKAISDLGLAYLMMGENQEGLKYLHEAQQLFKATDQYEELLQSLENEIVYLEHIGESERARQLRAKLVEIEHV